MFRMDRTVAKLTCSLGADQSKSNVYFGWNIYTHREYAGQRRINLPYLSGGCIRRKLTGLSVVDALPMTFWGQDMKSVAWNRQRICLVWVLNRFVIMCLHVIRTAVLTCRACFSIITRPFNKNLHVCNTRQTFRAESRTIASNTQIAAVPVDAIARCWGIVKVSKCSKCVRMRCTGLGWWRGTAFLLM